MKSLAVKHNLSVRMGSHAAVMRNTRLNLQACTLWSLHRKSSKDQIDLTGPIGNHRVASIASKDFVTEEVWQLSIYFKWQKPNMNSLLTDTQTTLNTP